MLKNMETNNPFGQRKITRRTALKYMGLGAALIPASWYLTGCSGRSKMDWADIKPDIENVPIDKMTYTTISKTGDRISLLGFGTMRYPTVERETPEGVRRFIDEAKAEELIDFAMTHGVNYFDTAWGYHQGESEIVTGKLLKKYPRESFFVATKMPGSAKSREDAIAIYHKQLEKMQLDYFDYYHLHSLSNDRAYERLYKEWGILDFLLNEKKEGRIRNLGFSFHGNQAFFDKLLAEPIEWDFVMIQMNYLDWKYGRVPASYMYSELEKRNIPVMIMEPLLGGRLTKVSRNVIEMMTEERPNDTPARWAFRFVGSHPRVMVVLSGMTLLDHLKENIKTYSPLEPMTDKEKEILQKAADIITTYKIIPCTDCKYCVPCPYGVDIPGILLYFNKATYDSNVPNLDGPRDAEFKRASRAFLVDYDRTIPELEQANHCINCGECIPTCPQRIKIPSELLRIDHLVQQLKAR
jgi:predicted aldo/keto reductase-like oxidoreductase